jgi:hypothetical protein
VRWDFTRRHGIVQLARVIEPFEPLIEPVGIEGVFGDGLSRQEPEDGLADDLVADFAKGDFEVLGGAAEGAGGDAFGAGGGGDVGGGARGVFEEGGEELAGARAGAGGLRQGGDQVGGGEGRGAEPGEWGGKLPSLPVGTIGIGALAIGIGKLATCRHGGASVLISLREMNVLTRSVRSTFGEGEGEARGEF